MKRRSSPTIRAHLIRSAFLLLLLVAVCVVPFALAQRVIIQRIAPKPRMAAPQLPYDLGAVPELPASRFPKIPSPNGVCNVIVNGGFATGNFTGWIADGNVDNPPVVTNTLAHTGTYSAFAGGDPAMNQFCGFGTELSGNSSYYQQFTVPAGGGTLSFWHWDCTTDTITFDWQDAYITDSNGNILQTIFHQCLNGQTWIQQTVDLGPYAGQTVRIKFLVHNDNFGDLTGMYVNDVEVLCGAPSPTPTATPKCIPITISGSINNGDPTQVNRVFRSGTASSCGGPLRPCSIVTAGAIHYNAYTFTNTTGSTQCVTVYLNTSCGGTNNIFTVAYLGSFDPNNVCTNYLADEGQSPNTGNQFSFNLDNGQAVVLVVSEVTSGAGCPSYGMTVSGACVAGPTPTPTPTASATATPSGSPPCTVSGSACGIDVQTQLTDFIINASGPVDPATLQPSDFTCNGIPANAATLSNNNSTITFHFTASPVLQGQNTMHIPQGAFTCDNDEPVVEFTCPFSYQASTPTPTPTATATATATSTATATATATATFTPTSTPTTTPPPTPTATPTATSTITPRPTPTPRSHGTPRGRPTPPPRP